MTRSLAIYFTFGAVCALAALASLGALGCDDRHTNTPVRPEVRSYDLRYDDGNVVADLYNAHNPRTRRTVSRSLTNQFVSVELERFNRAGYTLRTEHCLLVEGTTGEGRRERTSIEILVLAVANPQYESREAVHLYCIGGAEAFAVVPIRVTSEDRGGVPGFDRLGEGPWFEVIEPIGPAGPSRTAARSARFDWRRWSRCVAGQIFGSAASCLLQCRWLPLSYPQCVAVCTGARSLGGTIACTIFELF